MDQRGISQKDELVLDLKEKFVAYENWLTMGCKDDQFPPFFPREYFMIANRSMMAYDFYRDNLYYYIEKSEGKEAYLQEIYQTYNTAKENNLDELEKLLNKRWSDDFRYKLAFQYSNSFELIEAIKSASLNHHWLSAYQAKYEIEGILFLLINLLEIRDGGCYDDDLACLCDKKGNLKKGAAVEAISNKLAGEPHFQSVFNLGYRAELRNTIGHNKYRLDGNRILSLDSSIETTEAEFFESLESIMDIHNSVKWVFDYFNKRFRIPNISHRGLITIAFDCLLRELNCYQIWCFANEDKSKSWLNKVKFTREGNDLVTEFSNYASTKGKIYPDLQSFLSKLRNGDTIKCRIIPIAPYINPEKENISFYYGDYEVFEASDIVEKDIVVELVGF